ncbi:MAG: hypothetical protein ACREKR_01440 [Candidatus Methylomirabilales bacterium]
MSDLKKALITIATEVHHATPEAVHPRVQAEAGPALMEEMVSDTFFAKGICFEKPLAGT